MRDQDATIGHRRRVAKARRRAGVAGLTTAPEDADRGEIAGVAATLLERADAAIEDRERAGAAFEQRHAVHRIRENQHEAAIRTFADIGRLRVADRGIQRGRVSRTRVRGQRALREQRVVVGEVPVDAPTADLIEAVACLLGRHRDPAFAHHLRVDLGVRQHGDLLRRAGGQLHPPDIRLRARGDAGLARRVGLATGRREHQVGAIRRPRGIEVRDRTGRAGVDDRAGLRRDTDGVDPPARARGRTTCKGNGVAIVLHARTTDIGACTEATVRR